MTIILHANNFAPHVHGQATGSIILDQKKVVIELKIPSQSMVGFEYFPQSKKDQDQVQRAIKKLNQSNLFSFYTKGGFFVQQKELRPIDATQRVTTTMIRQNKLSDLHDDHSDHEHNDMNHNLDGSVNHTDVHSEFIVNYSYIFESTAQIAVINTKIFEEILNLDLIILSVLTNDHQLEKKVNKHNSKIKLK